MVNADSLNKYFVETGPRTAAKIALCREQYDPPRSAALDSFSFEPCSSSQVSKIIDSLDLHTASGYDKIPNKFLKRYKSRLLNSVVNLLNMLIKASIFPDDLKIAIVVPVYKSGPKSDLSNYRPIFLVPAIAKLYEKILFDQILKYMLLNNLISESQYGFLPGRSTEDALLKVNKEILHLLNNKEKVVSIFIDISKAFDTIEHKLLLKKLEYLGFSSNAVTLIKSYLDNRKQCVRLNQTLSPCRLNKFGVPQGSVLGPLLFIIYLNDIYTLSLHGQVITYADDTCILLHHTELNTLFKNANEDLLKINKWMSLNSFLLNNNKSNYVLFSLGKTIPCDHVLTLHLFNSEESCCNNTCLHCPTLKRTDCVKYLGIFLDEQLNYKSHINMLCSKLRFGLYILNRLKHMADLKLRKIAYYAFIQSHLQYGLNVWGGFLHIYY